MKHGNFYNASCKYCARIQFVTWLLLFVGASFIEYRIFVHPTPNDDALLIAAILPIALIIVMFLWKRWLVHLLPQSHGYLMDATGDTSWRKREALR